MEHRKRTDKRGRTATRTKYPDCENWQTQHKCQGDDCTTRRPGQSFGCNGEAGALDLRSRPACSQVRGARFWPSCCDVCFDHRHIRNEAVATFWESFDKSWILRRVP